MAERIETVISSQRRLLSDISHELRSPLARMNVAIGLMRQRGAGADLVMVARLEREAERLNRMIGDLLTLSRLESGERVAEPLPFDLAELVADVVGDARFEAGARGCHVQLAPSAPAPVSGASELLRSALENVVRNAVRHTADGTAVEVALAGEDPGTVVVEVRDRGPGVPADYLERIFEPFNRLDEARDRQSGGAGLGLAIAKRAVVQHGGTIEARAADGGGLAVRIRLPRAASA
jgi:two-component system sensor histidine kinase CpxA